MTKLGFLTGIFALFVSAGLRKLEAFMFIAVFGASTTLTGCWLGLAAKAEAMKWSRMDLCFMRA